MAKIKLTNDVKISEESLNIFIDTTNVIASQGSTTAINYTASANSFFCGKAGAYQFRLDGVAMTPSDGLQQACFYLKKGQVVTAPNYNGWSGWTYKVFGLK